MNLKPALLVFLGTALLGQTNLISPVTVLPKADLTFTGELRFRDKQATPHYIGFKAPDSVSANVVWTWMGADAVGSVQSDGAGHLSIASSGAASVINGFLVTGKSAVGPPVTTMGSQFWYETADHSTNWLSYDNAAGLSPINVSASQINLKAATIQMSGNVTANAIGTLSLGSAATPFGSTYALTNVSSKKFQIYDAAATDLTLANWAITADASLITHDLNITDAAGNSAIFFSNLFSGSSIPFGAVNGSWVPGQGRTAVDNTYNLGNTGDQWAKLYLGTGLYMGGTLVLDSGRNLTVASCTGCGGGGGSYLPLAGGMMTGNITANAVGTLSLGSAATPFGSTYALTNVSSKKFQIYDAAATDLTLANWAITADASLITHDLNITDAAGNSAIFFSNLFGGSSIPFGSVNGSWVPAQGRTAVDNTYNLGNTGDQWAKLYIGTGLYMGNTLVLDSGRNLTVASCTGCGGGLGAFLPLAGGTMTGNISANTAGTLSLGSAGTPFGSTYALTNVSSKKFQIYDQAATDLTLANWAITADASLITHDLNITDAAGNSAIFFSNLFGGSSIPVGSVNGSWVPAQGRTAVDNTYNLGNTGDQWAKLYIGTGLYMGGTLVLDSGRNLTVASCTGCGGAGSYLPLIGGFMTGNISSTPVGTLSLGSTTNPFGSTYALTNSSSKKFQIYDAAATDLTLANWAITSDASLINHVFRLTDPAGNIAIFFENIQFGSSLNPFGAVNGSWVPGSGNISVDNTYNLGNTGDQWAKLYLGTGLYIGGTLVLDSGRNLTVTSCTGCGGGGSVANGFFVTGQTTVAPPSTAAGLQVYHDPGTHTSYLKSYGAGSAITNLDFTGFTNHNQQASFLGGISMGSTPTITAAGSGAPMQLIGATAGNGNILLQPGAVAGNSSVRISQTTNGQAALILTGFAGATAATMLELRDSGGTARWWVEAPGNSTTSVTGPNWMHTASIMPAVDATYSLGGESGIGSPLRYLFVKAYTIQAGVVPTDVPTGAQFQSVANGMSAISMDAFGATGSAIPSFIGRQAGGSNTFPSATLSGAVLFSLTGRGYNGGFTAAGSAAISFLSTDNFSSGGQGADIYMQTTPAGLTAASRATRAIFTSTGMNPASDNTGSLGTFSSRWNAANIFNLTVTGTCTGCGGGSFNPAATIAFTGTSDSFSNPLSTNSITAIGGITAPSLTSSGFVQGSTFQNTFLTFNVDSSGDISATALTASSTIQAPSIAVGISGNLTLRTGATFNISPSSIIQISPGGTGQTCSGTPSSSFATVNGIVTHC
jgi:hypothetical protein